MLLWSIFRKRLETVGYFGIWRQRQSITSVKGAQLLFYLRTAQCRQLEKRYRFCLRHSHVVREQDGKYYFEREGHGLCNPRLYKTPEAAIDAAIRHGW